MDPAQWLMALFLLLCISLSSFFSASETAFMAVNRVRLKNLSQRGNRKAGKALKLTEDYDRLITTILVGNNIVNTVGTAVATVLFTGLLGNVGATVSAVLMTVVILFFGEVTPKTLAKQSPEQVACLTAGFLSFMLTILHPVNTLFKKWQQLVQRFFRPQSIDSDFDDELISMVDEAQSEGDMDAHEGELIRSAIELKDSDALDVMTPRVDVIALEDTASMDEAADIFRKSEYSRIPVFHEDMDHVVGILHEKDFYKGRHAGVESIVQLMVPPVYAPSTLKVSRLLKLFQSTRTHIVIVLDEFGGTEGIVTMEDVLEELVGEIYDEHDDIFEDVVSLEDGSLLVNGSLPLQDIVDALKLTKHYESDTVGGWAAEVSGCIPTVGSVFETEGIRGTVTAMDRRRVTQVRIAREDTDAGNAEEK